jgi:hypothetical protein
VYEKTLRQRNQERHSEKVKKIEVKIDNARKRQELVANSKSNKAAQMLYGKESKKTPIELKKSLSVEKSESPAGRSPRKSN